LLGDDIVIADKAVADSYLAVMTDLGVEINLSKSLESQKGVFEFAKRLVSPQAEYSPIGPKAVLQVLRTYNAIPGLIIDYLGKGYVPATE